MTALSFLISIRFLFFAEPAPQDWLTLDSERFKIYYTAADRSRAAALPAIFENEYAELSAKLGLQLDIPVQILLAPTPEKFNEFTGHLIPDWGEGVADAARGLIILKTLSPSSRDRLLKSVRHELTHILVGRGVAQPETLPRWFNEGLAIYFSYDEEFAGGAAISKALISNSVVPLNEIEDVLKFQTEKARLAYEESFSAILYFEEEFGFEGIAAILAELKAGKAFDDAFEEYTGFPAAEFELDWLRFIEQKYRWRFLLDFETYLWIFILLLFVLVFLGIKWRNRRTLKRWEDEEKILGR